MTKLSSLLQNGPAIRDGRWIKLGGALGSLEILTRGYTDAWADDRNRRIGELNARFAESGQVPISETRAAQQTAWADNCFLDVRGIEDDDGNPVSKEQFIEAMRGPGGADLWAAAQRATGAVHTSKEAVEKAVAGNSAEP